MNVNVNVNVNVVTKYTNTDVNISKNRINTHQDKGEEPKIYNAHVYIFIWTRNTFET